MLGVDCESTNVGIEVVVRDVGVVVEDDDTEKDLELGVDVV